MLFNSVEFALFFLSVYFLYFVLRHKGQNILLLVASYVFYAAWDWRFLFLLIVTTCVDYLCALAMDNTRGKGTRKSLVLFSIISNLIVLGFFKYYGFFARELHALLHQCGLPLQTKTLDILLPVGISFYTFQSLSYTIDVYRRKIRAARSLTDFALYVAFFPQLVAGPIERAGDLLPQIQRPRTVIWEGVRAGLYLVTWGLFKKCVIADNLAPLADAVFDNPGLYSAGEIWLGALAFAFQIYGDFSGYSDMARGIAGCLGFRLTNNFDSPYLSTNVQEFWHRWHVTLSRWFRDYVYIPLGGNRQRPAKTYRNIVMTMTLAGLWHGASWHFVAWGAYHGVLLVAYKALRPRFSQLAAPRAWKVAGVIVTFHLVCIGWILFRVTCLSDVVTIWESLFRGIPSTYAFLQSSAKVALFSCLLIGLEWWPYIKKDSLAYLQAPAVIRTLHYSVILFLLLLYGAGLGEPFIYFQF